VRAATATIVSPDGTRRLPLAWTGEHTLEARFSMNNAGMFLGAVQLGTGRVLPLAPLNLPYSPEFEPRTNPREGQEALAEMARVTGGTARSTWDDVFDESRLRTRQVRDLVIPLTLLLLLLHVAEIGGRRLFLFAAAQARLRRLRLPRLRRRAPAAETAATPPTHPEPTSDDPSSLPPGEVPRVVPPRPVISPLARAKAKARDRMGG
jgi:hypothetical protein